jgi:competence protein ComEA
LFSDDIRIPISETETVKDLPQTESDTAETVLPLQQEEAVICVYVCGRVRKPGVYELPQDARVMSAVDAAGGMCDDADPFALNLARPLTDGEEIYVPAMGEDDTPSGKEDGRINLNTADAALLKTLPGIGEAKAEAIISYREKEGPFAEVEDLLKVPGIKGATFEGLQEKVKVR